MDNLSIKNKLDVHNSLSKYILADGMKLVLDLDKSQGANIYDRLTNSEYLDLFTCFASMPIGFNHPEMNNEAFISKIGRVALNKPSNSDLYTEEYADFVYTFFKLAVPDHFKYSFYISGGALAVENALKAAFDWKIRKNLAKGLPEDSNLKVIYFNQAFHGRSGYTMTMTNTNPDKVMYFPKFDWVKVSNPNIKFPLEDNLNDLIDRENHSLNQVKKAFAENPNKIASVIIEPIQGEGGDNHFRAEFLQRLKEICLEEDSLLIFDEVQTGVGITGTWWAHQQLAVEPDIMAFGKKMQTCGILAGQRIDEVQDNVFHKSSRINSTWGGNLVDMVRVTKYLEIIHNENLLENAQIMGGYLLQKIQELQNKNPEKISNVRGRGLFAAFDLHIDRAKFLETTFEKKLIILPCGKNSIRFRPPLNVRKSEIDKGLEIIENSL